MDDIDDDIDMNDDQGGQVMEDNKEIEEVEPEDPIPLEKLNPLKLEQIRKYLKNFTKTFSGMSYAFTTFDCSEKEIDNLCIELENFIHLRDVNISKNKISLISGFNNMTHLIRFDARENDIRDMNCLSDPEKFKYLQLLYLSQNKIKVLPPLYADNLIELHLDNNKIKNASMFQGLKKVRFINLSNNKLKTCEGLANCPELVHLKLNENEIKTFKGMGGFPKLVNLEISNNKFDEFKDEIPQLNSLKKLNISGCAIAKIEEFGKLKFPLINEIICSGNPSADEVGAGIKTEMLILFEGFDLKIVNEDEIVPEDIKEAMDKKEERRIEAERLAEEKRIKEEEERIEREKEEKRLEEERLEREELERQAREEEERLKLQMEGDNMGEEIEMGDHMEDMGEIGDDGMGEEMENDDN